MSKVSPRAMSLAFNAVLRATSRKCTKYPEVKTTDEILLAVVTAVPGHNVCVTYRRKYLEIYVYELNGELWYNAANWGLLPSRSPKYLAKKIHAFKDCNGKPLEEN